MGSNRIIHNAKDRLTGNSRLPVDQICNAVSQGILKKEIIPLSLIQEVSHNRSMMLAGQGEIRCFATVSTQKGRKNDSHKMLQVNIG